MVELPMCAEGNWSHKWNEVELLNCAEGNWSHKWNDEFVVYADDNRSHRWNYVGHSM